MKDFRVAGSGVGGFIPSEIALLTSMERLELGYNKFRGNLLTEIGKLTSLFYLGLNDNQFEGPVPSEMGRLFNMTRLQMQVTRSRERSLTLWVVWRNSNNS